MNRKEIITSDVLGFNAIHKKLELEKLPIDIFGRRSAFDRYLFDFISINFLNTIIYHLLYKKLSQKQYYSLDTHLVILVDGL